MHQQMASTDHEHASHDLDQRGEQGMGFNQKSTTHHFLLKDDGGIIQVTANSAEDRAAVDQIRKHLQHIAREFQSGDFNIPMFVHDQTPPGVQLMKKLNNQISYTYAEVENGGRVEISSQQPEAVAAVHEFLKFQITEHRTGDRQ